MEETSHMQPLHEYLVEHPTAFFGILAGGRFWVFNPTNDTFTASDNKDMFLEAEDPLLRTEIAPGVFVSPILKFDNLDELLDYISNADFEEAYIHAVGVIQQSFMENVELLKQAKSN